jgi:signal transduction histidine kinase
MLRSSIRLRLTLIAALTIAVALACAGMVLIRLFDRQVTWLGQVDLHDRAIILMSALDPRDPLRAPARDIGSDPRYLRPYSGYYWQLDVDDRIYRSQSLWDASLPLGTRPALGGSQNLTGAGPDGQRLMILDRMISLGEAAVPVRLTVAVSRRALTEAQQHFTRALAPFLAIMGALLILAAFFQVVVGLRPFRRIGESISRLHEGKLRRLGQEMPQEVQPLAQAIDDLLDERDARVEKARNRAADLAHALKTPLQALLGEARRLDQHAQPESAAAIEQLVAAMKAHIDHGLGRERIAGQGQGDPSPIAMRVADVLRRTPRGAEVEILVDVAPRRLCVDPQDLTEALGSLAENALRHARSRVRIRSQISGASMVLIVEDDGAGIPEAMFERITDRGVRLSDDPQGDGLGLALVREIAMANGGSLTFENHPEGFQARLSFNLAILR